jgi:hypothetical protein
MSGGEAALNSLFLAILAILAANFRGTRTDALGTRTDALGTRTDALGHTHGCAGAHADALGTRMDAVRQRTELRTRCLGDLYCWSSRYTIR